MNKYRKPYLYDAGGDITKQWCVRFSVYNPETNRMVNVRKYADLYQTTAQERYEAAEGIIQAWENKLKSGWTPWEDGKYQYVDQVAYYNKKLVKRTDKVKTFNYYANQLLVCMKDNYRRKTILGYKSKLRLFEIWLEERKMNNFSISEISNTDIIDFHNYLTKELKREPVTIKKYMQVINAVFKNADLNSPVYNLPPLPRPKKSFAARPIPEKLLLELTKELKKDTQLWLAICFEFYTFIRPEELRNLKLENIDFSRWTITIPSEISKNKKTQTIGIPDSFKGVLDSYRLETFPDNWFVFSKGWMPGPTRLGQNTLATRFRVIRDRLGVSQKYKLYSFKHTGAIMLADAGVPMKDIQQHMRHSSFDTTDRYFEGIRGRISEKVRHNYPEL